MKRSHIFIAIIVVLSLFNKFSFAQQMPSKNIHQAASEGDIKEINLNLQNKTDVNEKNRFGYTALHAAIMQKQQEAVNLLLEKGADVNVVGGSGQTALHLAVTNGQKDLVEKLIAKGAEINTTDNRGQNALTISRNNRLTEITELLLAHGATEPVIDDMDRYGGAGRPGATQRGVNQQNNQTDNQYQNRMMGQAEVEEFELGDPNEIRERIKTFKDLDKKIKEVTDKSNRVMRQWRQTRSDNRSILIRSVETQYVDELGLVKKIATEEKAKKTVEEIDRLMSVRKERYDKIGRELLLQRREQRQEEAAQARGRGRTSGRTSRRSTRTGDQYGSNTNDSMYSRSRTTTRTERSMQTEEPEEQLDPATQEEMDLWLDSSVDDKENLLPEVHGLLFNEIGTLRSIAEQEEAKQTVAAIDGLLLARQERVDEMAAQMEEDRIRAQEREERNQAGGDSARGRRGRGGTEQWNSSDQQGQTRSRSRRR